MMIDRTDRIHDGIIYFVGIKAPPGHSLGLFKALLCCVGKGFVYILERVFT